MDEHRASLWTAIALSVAAAAAGCQSIENGSGSHAELDAQSRANEAVVREVFDHARQNAAAADPTVHPYHFAPDGAALNRLGEQRVGDLAAAYRSARGPGVAVARGDAAPDLYRARVQAVLDRLAGGGVDVGGLAVQEGPPAGAPRVSSARAAQLWLRDEVPETGQPASGGGNGSPGAGRSTGEGTAGTGGRGR